MCKYQIFLKSFIKSVDIYPHGAIMCLAVEYVEC